MSAVRLAFDRAGCVRGGRTLFEDLSFALGEGDAAVVSGPNGAGKSSLLRLAAGLLHASSGRVEASGAIALADEGLALDRRQPLARALAFWALLDGGAVSRGLSAMGLDHLAEVPVRMLSTGQRKRAVLARAIAGAAPIWLLDEPANGLDAASLDRLGAAMAAHRAAGGIVLAASHQPLPLPGAQRIDLA